MRLLPVRSAIIGSSLVLISCSGIVRKHQPAKTDDAAKLLFDTTKLKGDMNTMMNTISDAASGRQPDTPILKASMADVMTTAGKVLSDSGIASMGGNEKDPSVMSAKKTLIKMRNGIGITPSALDSMKKTIAQLQKK